MSIPKRVKNFRDKAKEEAYDAQKEYEESYKSKDDRGFIIGSVFDLDVIKEMGIEVWRPDIGEHVIDVIPFYAGIQHPVVKQGLRTYKVDFWAHQRIGALNEFFVCQSNTWKKPDPICTYMSQNYIDDKNEYKAIKPSRRCAYLVWVHDNEEQQDKGIQIFEVAHFFFEKKVSEIARKPRGGGFIDWTCYDKGKHVYWTIGVTGTYEDASGTKRDSIEYTAFQLIERDTPSIPDRILEQSFALDEVIVMHPEDKIVNMAFYGTEKAPKTEEKETSDRLQKKTPLERAKEEAAKKEKKDEKTDEDKMELVEGLVCEECGAEVYDTDSGRVCSDGHGGIEGIVPQKEDDKEEKEPEQTTLPEKDKKEDDSTEYICPASELGGVFGESIEQMEACDDCDIWKQCSDANYAKSKSTGKLVARS